MTSFGLFYSPTATNQNDLSLTDKIGFKLVNGLRVPTPLGNCAQNQQHDTQQPDFAGYVSLFHSPTAELLRGRIVPNHRLVNGYHVPKKIGCRNTTPFPFEEEKNLFHSPTAALVSDKAWLEASVRYIDNLRIPPRIGGNQHQSINCRHDSLRSTISEPQSQSQSWLSFNEPIIYSPTAASLRGPEGDCQLRTNNDLRIPRFISRRRKTTDAISSHKVEMRVGNAKTEASGVFQKHPFKIMSRPIDFCTHYSYKTASAAHVIHADPNNVEDDGDRPEAKQAQLCRCVDLAISQLHDPFTNEDRHVLRQILSYLDQRRHELFARRISVDSNAPQINVPASWLEVADLAFEGIRTVDYPYLLRVMQAIDILACGIWYADSEQQKYTHEENTSLEFI
ncbi:hypothetical protein CGRA01v4_13339 [Colletotrichum graminicola]|uniref:Uncharacterized protein n=1 Tax=Colletotrichum graminicola (strain M1.001 / M2 / FGSC 10212) TaxID=645133 RepID=E3QWX2_COLGM|nr:uncharacterized protein GLRG_10504 [Colletotrichum graminicola M1.001]EFQ35360.1 hypothetical protein GLRG_10504 [Colletotrichum graminicola M1.001]WDK22049.1 hypothetical protein CGRA01v4_13339 [Colletotrichum graminicola]